MSTTNFSSIQITGPHERWKAKLSGWQDCATTKDYDIFMAESADNGATFGPNVRVSTETSNPDFDGFGGTFIGDYFGLSSAGVPVWGDTRLQKQTIFGAFFQTQ